MDSENKLTMITAKNGVRFLRTSLLPCTHGFSTRVGGVSTIPTLASLNLIRKDAEPEENFTENMHRFAEAVGFDPATMTGASQAHTAEVLTLTAADAGYGYTRPWDQVADGYVTREHGITIGVRTADCVPILAAAVNEKGEAYMVGAFHAGWRGTVKGIAGVGIRRMAELGADVREIRVAMGPSICRNCFPVSKDARKTFLEYQGEERVARCLRPDPDVPGTYYADLFRLNREILAGEGILPEHIVQSDLCTACHPELFFSHRVTGYDRGSLLSVISLD